MKYITVKNDASGDDIQLSYCDYGKGRPVVLIHGWPLSKEMWEYQIADLVNAGLRVIKYDRRGFGKSSKPWDGYDYDTLADDLHAIIEELDLREATLAGFSMGGGEVVRYLSRHGSDRISKIVLVSAITPYLCQTPDNPEGVDPAIFKDMNKQIREDRIGFLEEFGKKFFGVTMINKPVSKALLEYYLHLGSVASQRSTLECARSFAMTDFRNDLKAVDVPVLLIHGDNDETVPIDASGARTAKMLDNCEYKVYEGAPHGLFYTHREALNRDLVQFITASRPAYAGIGKI